MLTKLPFLQKPMTIRAATVTDRLELANLIHYEPHVHRHLDWRTPLEWLGAEPYLILQQKKEILAALACPPEPPQVAWVRLFAVASHINPERAWELIWPDALNQLTQFGGVKHIAAIPLSPWFGNLLQKEGFQTVTDVVMLEWDEETPIPDPHPGSWIIRPMNYDELDAVELVDEQAFSPLWQNTISCLQMAYQQAAWATVAELDGQMVAYQISTATSLGGHLARLAVIPDCRGLGIGAALLRDLLLQFKQRGAYKVTVNTQKDNDASLALYQKSGFHLTGEGYPVYDYPLSKPAG
jgi:ribosomal protein S18 acetylase RimI-like enzyme